jgi:hypothetical protein
MMLIPVDDRPATGQFAQMIAGLAETKIETPPTELLGQYTLPGDPDGILSWMERQDLRKFDAVIVSTDMIGFGGLIASRVPLVDLATATSRIDRLARLKSLYPEVPFYGFSALMRLYPTSTLESKPWREILVRNVIARSECAKLPNFRNILEVARLSLVSNQELLNAYYQTRDRNFEFQKHLISQTASKTFDFLILGQDDARTVGPQLAETAELQKFVEAVGVPSRTYFCEGIDQHANVLVSRAILRQVGWQPKVRIVYADPQGVDLIPAYETQPVAKSTADQIIASGGILTDTIQDADYSLYLNTPEPRSEQFADFIDNLGNEIAMGFPVAVADINLGKTGTGDPKLFQALNSNDRASKLLAYAGWNTAGNTLGTAVPAANVYLGARRASGVDPFQRELNQRAFLLHRLVNDFEYHRFTRPLAYEFIDNNPPATREETYGEKFEQVNQLVKRDVSKRLENTFEQQFRGDRFFAGTKQYEIRDLQNVQIELPWPRAYEVRIGFSMNAREVR